jgi:dihydrofolate reductase
MGKTIIMGRRTFEEIGHALANRYNIVLSRTMKPKHDIMVANSFENALSLSCGEEIFVIGGMQVYQAAMPYAEHIYLTQVHAIFDADVFFPQFDTAKQWKEIERQHFESGSQFVNPFDFVVYEKNRQNCIH